MMYYKEPRQILGFLFGGTPDFLLDTRRGLYSYEALQSRLAENTFVSEDLVDFSGPVIKLANLTPEDMFVLLSNIRTVVQGEKEHIPDSALKSFMNYCSQRIGEAYFRTPRNTVTAFVNLLAVLEQNPNAKWESLLEKVEIKEDTGDDLSEVDENVGEQHTDDELANFKL